MLVLLNSKSKVNIIHTTFAKKLGFSIRLIDVRTQKINDIILDTYGMIVTVFSVTNKANKVKFFKETFVVANVSPELVFGMLFFFLNGANVDFLDWEFRWRTYITQKAFLTIRHVELVEKKKFTAVALDPKYKIFIIYISSVHVISLNSTLFDVDIYSFCRPQIVSLIANKAHIKVFAKYTNFTNIFFLYLAFVLSKYTEINDYTIELVDS